MLHFLLQHSGSALVHVRHDYALCAAAGKGHLDIVYELIR